MSEPQERPPAAVEIDPDKLADAIVAGCWAHPGEPYCFTFSAECVAAIVNALREAAILRTQH
jgi:hypothetical protein